MKRGFYAGHPVRDGRGAVIGVAVMKMDLDGVEKVFRRPLFFLVDPHGVIFLSSRKEMLFKSLWPVDPEAGRRLLESRQFGDKPFEAIMAQEITDGMEVEFQGDRRLVSRRAFDPQGWSVVVMNGTESIFLYRSVGVTLTVLMCTLIVVPLIVNYKTARSAALLRESEARFRELFGAMPSGVVIYRALENGGDFIITDINPAGERTSRVKKRDIVGKQVTEVFPGIKELGLLEVLQQSWRTGAHLHHPVSLYLDERISHWVENDVYRLDSGEVVAIYDDVTEQKRMEEEIRALSITDPLTGLFNRRGFLALTEKQLKIADRTRKAPLLFYIDLDGMKWINDRLGHKEGDNAIMEAAAVLRETFRSADIIARMGGDEFAVLAVDMTEANSDIYLARLQDRVDRYNRRENRKFSLSLSVGFSRYDPENPSSLDDLVAEADDRMYQDKQRKREGKGTALRPEGFEKEDL